MTPEGSRSIVSTAGAFLILPHLVAFAFVFLVECGSGDIAKRPTLSSIRKPKRRRTHATPYTIKQHQHENETKRDPKEMPTPKEKQRPPSLPHLRRCASTSIGAGAWGFYTARRRHPQKWDRPETSTPTEEQRGPPSLPRNTYRNQCTTIGTTPLGHLYP